MRRSLAILALLGVPISAAAEAGEPSAASIEILRDCLMQGDAAFEYGLGSEVDEVDTGVLVNSYRSAPLACGALAVERCDQGAGREACLFDLAAWVRGQRGRIASDLPVDIAYGDAFTEARYARRLAHAGGLACTELPERPDCVQAELNALNSAYGAWRMARRAGVIPLEGYGPVDVETLR